MLSRRISQLRLDYKQSQSRLQLLTRCLHFSPREIDHFHLHNAGRLAQYRLARGLRLNYPEAVALISMQMLERIRGGNDSVSSLMSLGQQLLGVSHVMPGVASMIQNIQVEGTFPDGTKLLTVHSPIASLHGNVELALEGSFLPIPDISHFSNDLNKDITTATDSKDYAPGQVLVQDGHDITINANRPLIELQVTNTGDRPIQVGSHYAFVETNAALLFDRRHAIGKRLNVPSGASVRFEPGESKTITLVNIGGTQHVVSGNRLTDGIATPDRYDDIMERVISQGFRHADAATVYEGTPYVMNRSAYADMYGPTKGDRVVLGDTKLIIRVEQDLAIMGDECKFGGGKSLREGMGQATGVHAADVLDVVITNALIVDPVLGIIKADVGIKGTSIVGIGKAGNPDMMQGVNSNMIVGVTTDVIAGEKLILTAGGIDTHIHFICPQQIDDAVASGITTMFGGGTGTSDFVEPYQSFNCRCQPIN